VKSQSNNEKKSARFLENGTVDARWRNWSASGDLPVVAEYDQQEKTLHVKGRRCFVVKHIAPPMITAAVTAEAMTEQLKNIPKTLDQFMGYFQVARKAPEVPQQASNSVDFTFSP
jgi:hypothetical protein